MLPFSAIVLFLSKTKPASMLLFSVNVYNASPLSYKGLEFGFTIHQGLGVELRQLVLFL
jgi:hypothetical protein